MATTPDKPATTAEATIGVYMQRPTFEAARGAYMADLDTLPTGPDTIAAWIGAALAAYAKLSPKKRAAIAEALPAEQRSETRGISRTFRVDPDILEAVNAALVADRKAGRWRSRSEFAVEAILWATDNAKDRAGGQLPKAPARLPNRAVR